MFLARIPRPGAIRSLCRPVQLAHFSDKKAPPKEPEAAEQNKPAKESAADRLNRLLTSMNTDEGLTAKKTANIPQAGARKQKRAESKAKKQQQEAEANKPQNIVQAAKDVADLMGDKTRQTEAELLSKLLNHIDGGSGKPSGEAAAAGDQSLSDLIVGMKIDRSKKHATSSPSRSDFVRKTVASRRARQDDLQESRQQQPRTRPRQQRLEPQPSTGKVNLFGERLGIFTEPAKLRDSPDILETWARLNRRELKLAVSHPPENYFEKMTLWTEQGKIWKFPIDNEQGLDDEAQVDFSDHVFLEQHLEGWCPDKGPIRHFMELVCVGLSKNPYVTAKDKREHILWYRDYFESKKDILKEVIVQQKTQGKAKELNDL